MAGRQADLTAIATLSLFEERIGALYDAGIFPTRFTSQVSVGDGSLSATTTFNRPRFVLVPGPGGATVTRLFMGGQAEIVKSGASPILEGLQIPTTVAIEALLRLSIVLSAVAGKAQPVFALQRVGLQDVQVSTSLGGRLFEVLVKNFGLQFVPDMPDVVNPVLSTLQADLASPLVEALKTSCAQAGISPGASGWQTDIRPLAAADGTVDAVAVELSSVDRDVHAPPISLEVQRTPPDAAAGSLEIPDHGGLMQPIRRIRDLFQSSRRPDQ